jgi:hypothetical protein
VRIDGWIKTVTADALHPAGRPSGFVIVNIQRGERSRDVRVELP